MQEFEYHGSSFGGEVTEVPNFVNYVLPAPLREA